MSSPQVRIGLCLSGGGFRAALFHLGALRRLNELGLLSQVATISSASGGSITNGLLATAWHKLQPNATGCLGGFEAEVAEPLRAFCRRDLRTWVLFLDWLKPWNWPRYLRGLTATGLLARRYGKSLGLHVRLADVPERPRFVFCACNLKTGVNWTFSRDRIGDYRAGFVEPGNTTVAQAVAASSAFPVTFPPLVLEIPPDHANTSQHPRPGPKVGRALLTDGGVYDNMALEPVWKDHDLVLVSYAGESLEPVAEMKAGLLTGLERSIMVMHNQCQALRKRWLIDSFTRGQLKGTSWSVDSDYRHYGYAGMPGYPPEMSQILRRIRIDLNRHTEAEICCLENHGYFFAEVAVQRHVAPDLDVLDSPFRWPHPEWVDKGKAQAALADSDKMHVVRDVLSGLSDALHFWRGDS